MASGTHSHGHSLDTLITVKVYYGGVARRTKMPLRDMVPATLESNLRSFLRIPHDTPMKLDRYSDSAGKFVHLDPTDVAIYKQLYRAAKAKSKLKIRATTEAQLYKTFPKPVTVEDEPEVAGESSTTETPEEKAPEMTQETQQNQVDISPAPTSATATLFDLPYRDSPAQSTFPDDFAPIPATILPDPSVISLANLIASRTAPLPDCAQEVPEAPFHTSPTESCSLFCPPPAPATTYSSICPAAGPAGTAFAVCCNNCEKTIPAIHYHCSTCDDGDFDICEPCLESGASCKGVDHWLIKRTIADGRLVNSTTKTLEPKRKVEPAPVVKEEIKLAVEPAEIKCCDIPSQRSLSFEPLVPRWASLGIMRTCNCCVQELPEHEFLHCQTCEDYDLCQPCFAKNAHGHHPKHGFSPAVKGTEMPRHIEAKMAPGRSQKHFAICDGCDKNIVGVRHKCLDCPDWDYCTECIKTKDIAHPAHRFVPVYEQLPTVHKLSPVHVGICCDGPLCAGNEAYPAYIHGTRYKCAICNDRDYCANCQSCPLNTHNKTHPMIMFRTPVRSATIVTTDGERNGQPARVLGDRAAIRTHKVAEAAGSNTINRVRTNVDIKPTEPASVKAEEKEPKPVVQVEKEAPAPAPVEKPQTENDLSGRFLYETIRDGTIMPGNNVFEQTWVLRNDGEATWPAGCSVKFVGGDYMGHVDSNHPAGIVELISASESTVCYNRVAPGEEFPFTVLLRTPARPGNLVSYWRLTSPSGHKFGDRLWCDVSVREACPKAKPEVKPATEQAQTPEVETPVEEVKKAEDSQASSQMIFPKLEKESPVSSIHEAAPSESVTEVERVETKTESGDEDWDISEDGFMTDEEYDILDASDEEYLEEQKKQLAAK
ncbi:hypothetical protein B0T10DRAFT_394136 [Thelonectria olida]|uniref:ZZ-type domain-containing protein n=1 Tax=Thelonectria olida TaxID=1576542 RepID=A0A9P8WGU9_9HYPO|nr:hypothetical protein B0T10DRAFT_394136 [Thelonectria olida]